MHCKRKRHSITLLEIMIVILLIGLIGGVLSYNLKGSLDRGKAFRTEEGIRRLKDILNLACEEDAKLIKKIQKDNNSTVIEHCVASSGFIPKEKIKDFLLDGWKEPYIVKIIDNDEIDVYSPRLEKYTTAKSKK